MQKTCVLLLVAVLLAAPVTRAETLVMRVGWEQARAMLARDDFFPKIRIELQSDERLTGKLIGTSDAGLQLKQLRAETTIAREDIRTIRFVYRKTTRKKNRSIALAAGIPAGVGAGLFGSLACCFSDGSPAKGNEILGYAVLVGGFTAVAMGLYRLGLRADRRAVLLELTETAAASAPPAPTHAEEPSPTQEEQP